jgi:hypothetical protein
MSVEVPASKSWSFGVYVFVFHVKPDCGSVIDGKRMPMMTSQTTPWPN